jgi:hypothetical protein
MGGQVHLSARDIAFVAHLVRPCFAHSVERAEKKRGGSGGMSIPFTRPQAPPSHTARLVWAVLRRRFMGGKHVRTAHRRTQPVDSRTPAVTAPPYDRHAKRWRPCPAPPGISGHEPPPEMPRLRRRPQASWTWDRQNDRYSPLNRLFSSPLVVPSGSPQPGNGRASRNKVCIQPLHCQTAAEHLTRGPGVSTIAGRRSGTGLGRPRRNERP